MKYKIIIAIIAISLNILSAQEYYAEVVAIKGVATYEKKKIVLGDKIAQMGTIETELNTMIKLYLHKDESFIVLGQLSKLVIGTNSSTINSQKGHQNFNLLQGSARWISTKKELISTELIVVQGNRGYVGGKSSDFVVINSPLHEEMELIVISGKVLLKAYAVKKNQVLVAAPAWAGLGGRFGTEVTDSLPLSATVIEHYKALDLVTTEKKED